MTDTLETPAQAGRWTAQWKELYAEVITTGLCTGCAGCASRPALSASAEQEARNSAPPSRTAGPAANRNGRASQIDTHRFIGGTAASHYPFPVPGSLTTKFLLTHTSPRRL